MGYTTTTTTTTVCVCRSSQWCNMLAGGRLPACLPASAIHPPTTNTLGGTYRNNRCDCSLFALFPDIDHEEALSTAASLRLHKQHTDRLESITLEAIISFRCTLESVQRVKQVAGRCDPVVRAINLTFH